MQRVKFSICQKRIILQFRYTFNSSLLEDDNYVNALRKNIDLFKAEYENVEDKGLKWDLIKMEIRGFTVKYAKTKAKRRKSEELTLQNKINELQLSLERNPNNYHAQKELLAAKLHLQKIMHFKKKRYDPQEQGKMV